jgi:small subunit ribosomal protein S14
MAKTNMLMREKKRLKVAKKYAKRRAELKELIRDPKTGQEGREAARCGCHAAAQSLLDYRPLTRRVP